MPVKQPWEQYTLNGQKALHTDTEESLQFPNMVDYGRLLELILKCVDDGNDFPSRAGDIHPWFIMTNEDRKQQSEFTTKLLEGVICYYYFLFDIQTH